MAMRSAASLAVRRRIAPSCQLRVSAQATRALSASSAARQQRSADEPSFSDSEVPSSGPRSFVPPNPYEPAVEYDPEYTTSRGNPLDHGFGQAGKYFSLGSDEELKALFPNGLAGELQMRKKNGDQVELTGEFAYTGKNSMLIRPMGVSLVHFMERWRQTSGRELAAKGSPVLDVDPSTPLEASLPPLGPLPKTRFRSMVEQMEADAGVEASEGEAGQDWLSQSVPYVSAKAGWRIPVMADPAAMPYRPLRVLTGPPGVGKSALLDYAVAYARKNGWLTLFVPDAFALMTQSRVLVASKRRPGFVDTHDSALAILRELFSASGSRELLSRVPQRGAYAVHRYLPRAADVRVTAERERQRAREEEEKARLKAEASATGGEWDASAYKSKLDDESNTSIDRSAFTLADMVEWGLHHPPAASDTLLDVLAELRRVTEFPVLIAIDNLNSLYETSLYPEAGGGAALPGERLTVPAAFQCLGPDGFKDSFGLARGMYLAAVSQRHGAKMRLFDVAAVKQTYRLRVPELTRQETHAQLCHYADSGADFLMLPGSAAEVDAFTVEYFRTLSSGIPREVFRTAMFTAQKVETAPKRLAVLEKKGLL